MAGPLRVCIDARLGEGAGGIQQFVMGLVSGLSRLCDGDEEYVVLGDRRTRSWLPELPPERWSLVLLPAPSHRGLTVWAKELALRASPRLAEALGNAPIVWKVAPPPIPRSDGTVERLRPDLVHFTTQAAFLTRIPSIYHPHDLQHLHLPALFSRRARLLREQSYRAFCEQARMVAVSSTWTREDVLLRYSLPPEKVRVIPLAPATEAYTAPAAEEVAELVRARRLPPRFAFYPAQTWPHKNHLALLEALALLRRSGVTVPLVCSGHLSPHSTSIRRRAEALGVAADTHLLGFVTPLELQCLYRASTCVVIPSLFEAASFPLWEAFLAGVPAACSNVTSLPAQAGDAALVFDPRDPEAMAHAIHRLWMDEPLRATLVERGRRNVARFGWGRTARTFRAHYRRLTGRGVTAEDAALLAEPPLL